MSADNGIYILNLKDQSRVIHAQAIDNLWWSFLTFNSDSDTFVPTRLVEYFGCSGFMKDKGDAISYAFKLAEDYPVLEYGVSCFDIPDKTWDELVKEAKELAIREIIAIKNRSNGEWKNKFHWYIDELVKLQDILEM